MIQKVFNFATTESALNYLRELDQENNSNWLEQVYGAIATKIDDNSSDYIRKHSQQIVSVGSVLFAREREIIVKSEKGKNLLGKLIKN